MKKREAAFTLLELLLALVILSTLVSVSAPGLNSLLIRIRLDADFRELYLDFLRARQLAITRQADFGLRFLKESREYILYSVIEGDLKSERLREGISYGEISFGGDGEMVFKPSGTAEGGHLVLTGERVKRCYEIIISGVTGRVRYEKTGLENK